MVWQLPAKHLSWMKELTLGLGRWLCSFLAGTLYSDPKVILTVALIDRQKETEGRCLT
jgi:hypothetical protein